MTFSTLKSSRIKIYSEQSNKINDMPNNSTPVLVDRFYPTLATVVNEDEIPEILGFLKEGIVFLFDKIYFEVCGLLIIMIVDINF